jgi:DNA-directed RNA polymerase sigma subunit (sigma70/sigma32)
MSEKVYKQSLRQIAEALGISADDVRAELRHAYNKLRRNPAVYALLRDYMELDTDRRGVWRRKA